MEKSALTLDPRDKQLLSKFTLGGAALGGGTALMTSLISYLRTLKQQPEDTAADDDTLFVNLPAGAKRASIGTGLAMAGGALSTAGAYALVRKLMRDAQKKDLQRQLDLAQNTYLGEIDPNTPQEGAPKAAGAIAAPGKPVGGLEMLLSSPWAAALLLAAASGAVAYKGLDSKLGRKPKETSPAPKRVVYRYADQTPSDAGQPPVDPTKQASFALPLDVGYELTGRLALSLCKDAGDFSDMVGAACVGRLDEMEINTAAGGIEAALDLVKGAASNLESSPASLRALALSRVMSSPVLGPTALMLANAEVVERTPYFAEKFACVEPEIREELCKVACALAQIARMDDLREVEEGQPLFDKAASATMDELLDRGGNELVGGEDASVDSGRSGGPAGTSSSRGLGKDPIDQILQQTEATGAAAQLAAEHDR